MINSFDSFWGQISMPNLYQFMYSEPGRDAQEEESCSSKSSIHNSSISFRCISYPWSIVQVIISQDLVSYLGLCFCFSQRSGMETFLVHNMQVRESERERDREDRKLSKRRRRKGNSMKEKRKMTGMKDLEGIVEKKGWIWCSSRWLGDKAGMMRTIKRKKK